MRLLDFWVLFFDREETSYILISTVVAAGSTLFCKNWCSADGDLGSGFGSCFFFYYAYADSFWLS